MFLKLKVSCTCHCDYYISERISTEKVVCPNYGKEHPYSHKIISMLHAANEIDDGNVPGAETIKTSVISEWEDVTERQ